MHIEFEPRYSHATHWGNTTYHWYLSNGQYICTMIERDKLYEFKEIVDSDTTIGKDE